MDWSKTRVTATTMRLLVDLARAARLEEKRDAMFAGHRINTTEDRAVLHVALRNLSGTPLLTDAATSCRKWRPSGNAALPSPRRCAPAPCAARRASASTPSSISASAALISSRMAAEALKPYGKRGLAVRFVSNVDGAHIADTLKGLDPARTLFVVVSKTFTTVETMTNAQTARNGSRKSGRGGGRPPLRRRLDQPRAVNAFGIAEASMFRFWDWVGGRYSVWSAVGLSLMIAVGPRHFTAFLAGPSGSTSISARRR